MPQTKERRAMEEARAFEQTRDLVNQALKAKWNPSPSNDGPYGPYVVQTFPDSVVYEWQGKTWSSDYSIDVEDGKSQVDLSDPTEVAVTYAPMMEATEAALESDFVALSEKALKKNGEVNLKLIQPGWGSSGYYSADMLERDGPTVFKSGTKSYWNHPTPEEEAGRPERDLRDLAAELTEDARWLPNGPEGAGLYAHAKVFGGYAPAVEELAPHIGVSIRAIGQAKSGQAEGRKGPIIEKLVSARSVDFVTEPGAGGQIVQLFESARNGVIREESQVDENEVKALREAKDAAEAELKTLKDAREAEQTELSRMREAAIMVEASVVVREALAEAKNLPEITRSRLAERLAANPPVKDGALDKDALKTVVEAAVKDEAEYLAKVSGSPIRGMNSETSDQQQSEANVAKLEDIFKGIGLSETAAKVAAAGRAN